MTKLTGRNLGADFELKDGFRMYHGLDVPGFPAHPHRGFETITLVRHGLVDHSDSLGATARFGGGDVQWMTAGSGIVHSEMFPLVKNDADNPVEMFQLWLNLPQKNKLTRPAFTMFWAENIPTFSLRDQHGAETQLTTIIGPYEPNKATEMKMPQPPQKSWAHEPENDVAVWTLKLDANAEFMLPAAQVTSLRSLYFFSGSELFIDHQSLESHACVELKANQEVLLKAGDNPVELLMLQGRPINEPVAQHGPFVMNQREELVTAIHDYQQTRFGGWPWQSEAPVHAKERGRFALHIDGTPELPPASVT
jgi:hypothetical protein